MNTRLDRANAKLDDVCKQLKQVEREQAPSVVKEVLDRLSAVKAVSEKLDITMDRVEKSADLLRDHERRLVALETTNQIMYASRRSTAPCRSPRKKK